MEDRMNSNSLSKKMDPVFTRYLYEKLHVKYSLVWSICERCREESLFWAYELYWSGFADEVWHWLREIYVKYYEETNPRFKRRLDEFYTEWLQSGTGGSDHGLLGTAVGTLAMRSRMPEEPEKMIVLRFSDSRHETVGALKPARKYLAKVSQWPIRPQAKYMAQEFDGLLLKTMREAYLGVNWLGYCAPVWVERLREFRGTVKERTVAFETEDDFEAFHETWGLEPDEQTMEMHLWHGIYPAAGEPEDRYRK